MTTVEALRDLIGTLPDPEIPVLTLDDLGIVRGIEIDDGGGARISLSPTYTGCPALDAISATVARVAREHGFDPVDVRLQLSPPWSTAWISEDGRRKLEEYGIAPPERTSRGCALVSAPPRCPRCGSENTREVSRFGSTPCQAHHACNDCLEPFDRFKAI